MNGQAAIDSNVLVALIDRQDKWHRRAQALLAALKAENVALVYFDCVLNETISVMARRAQEQKRAEEFAVLLDELLQWVPEDIIRVHRKLERGVRMMPIPKEKSVFVCVHLRSSASYFR